MSDTYEMTLSLKKNGLPLVGASPLVKRLTVAQSQLVNFIRTTGGGAIALPISQISDISLLIHQGDQAQTLTLGAVTLQPGSLILLWGATPATETLTNDSGNDSSNTIIGGGT